MKNILIIILSFVIIVQAENSLRYKKLTSKEYPHSDTHIQEIETWHDEESGQEFTCIFTSVDMGYGVSCFPTGRNWK